MDKLKMSATIPARPEEIYESWLDSQKHSDMTGSEAKVNPKINGKFTAWDGYIEGRTIELEAGRRIVQKWRTTDFPDDSPDSTVEIVLEKVEKGTKIVLIHTEIPTGQKDGYKQGWKDFYFDPMRDYFGS